MVYRYGWLAGIAGGCLALARLERLLRSSSGGLPWEVILLAAAVLGAAITWAGLAYRLSTVTVAVVNLAAMLLTVVRIAVPDTTWFVFPGVGSFPALGQELAYAIDVIRRGVAPVLPLAGIVAILAVVFWLLGGLLSWGLRRDRPYLAVLAPLVVYLQFATMDRGQSRLWTTGFLLLFGLALLAVALDRRRATGSLTTGPGRAAVPRSRPALAVIALTGAMLVTLLSTSALAGLLPRTGLLEWRVPSALTGDYYGSISYDPFVGIRQQLISPTGTPVFYTLLEGDLSYDRVYFRLVTLESFDGNQWYARQRQAMARPEEVDSLEDPGAAFRGPTTPVTQTVTILALEQQWLPAAYSPTGLTAGNRAVERGFRAKVNDASLWFDAFTYYGMSYRVVSAVPLPDVDVLALGEDGAPSPLFAEASAAEEDYQAPAPTDPPPLYELPDREDHLRLPDGIDPGVAALARRQVAGLTTDFERGLALEAFFRRPRSFIYSVWVEPGHGATDLSAWLLDPESPNYRTGYCEQFATAMAVMARQVGLPSRVVLGFTPGELLEDGRVVIRDRNAHAWVELWMPSQGWVRFDPTPRADEVNPAYSDELPFDVAAYLDLEIPTQPLGPGPTPPEPRPDDGSAPEIPPVLPVDTVDTGSWLLPAWMPITAGSIVLLFGLVPAVKWTRRRYRLRALAAGDVSAAWREIVDRLSDLGHEPGPGATPREVAAATDEAMTPLARLYGESIYGQPIDPAAGSGRVAVVARSLRDTEQDLAGRHSRTRRLAARYRLRSLDPRRWRRPR